MFRELGGDDAIIVATDGSFTADNNRSGWGYAVYHEGRVLTEEAGSHHIYASSTRMEFEAIKRALMWLTETDIPLSTVVFATDSTAVLSRIRGGDLPDGWAKLAERHLSLIHI